MFTLQKIPLQNSSTPSLQHHHMDSLMFSATSDKSPSARRETLLLDSRDDDVSEELKTLQLKLMRLQSKVQSIQVPEGHTTTTESIPEKENLFSNIGKIKRKGVEEAEKERKERTSIIGADFARSGTRYRASPKSSVQRNGSFRMSNSSNERINQTVNQLRKELIKKKVSITKSQRSRSVLGQRLMETRKDMASLRKKFSKKDKELLKLRNQLRKVHAIKEKQKEIIFKQREQIAKLKRELNCILKLRS